MFRKLSFITAIVIILTIFAGCAAAPVAATPAPTVAPTPTPEPIPDTDEMTARFSKAWKRESIAMEFPEEFFGKNPERYVMDTGLKRDWLMPFADNIEAELAKAAERVIETAFYGTEIEKNEFEISWQMAYALVAIAADEADAARRVVLSMEPDAVFTYEDGEVSVSITTKDIKYKERLAASDSNAADFIYAYANTLYNENGEVVEYVQPEPAGSLAEGIVWPLESYTRLRKTWFADRDRGKRRHTGTDIWAGEGTELYSCTDGTVTGVFYNDRAGNAVVVTDNYGYEYHYYHMVVLTDFLKEGDTVKAGDLVGYVGNTGNSACNHLHLTIVSDEGVLVNPYPYLEQVKP